MYNLPAVYKFTIHDTETRKIKEQKSKLCWNQNQMSQKWPWKCASGHYASYWQARNMLLMCHLLKLKTLQLFHENALETIVYGQRDGNGTELDKCAHLEQAV